ncbi:MAG: pilus assembly protein N-terminal domain-containing protein [Planctomycetota bacterium]
MAVGAVFLASLGTAVPALRPSQESGSALVEMLTSGRRTKELRPIVESSDAFLTFNKDIDKVFVGSPDVIKLSTSDKRTLSLNGVKVGRTSLTVVYAGSTSEQFMIAVQRDLSVLEGALRDVHPGIKAEFAPDRDAIVLSGVVPDATYSSRAASAARQYLSAGGGQTAGDGDAKASGQVINLIRAERASIDLETKLRAELGRQGVKNAQVTRIVKDELANDDKDIFVFDGTVADMRTLDNIRDVLNALVPGDDEKKDNSRVVNRMSLAGGGLEIEKVIEGAIRNQVGAPNVTVTRVSESSFRGEADILVLQGTVPNQTKLTQALTLASRLFLQQQLIKNKQEGQFEDVTETFAGGNTRNTRRPLQLKSAEEDIKVAADESGALKKKSNVQTNSAIGQIQPDSGDSSGGGGSQFGRLLTNQIESNIGRAKALELADGRILSFLVVEDLPQVRIDIRIMEVNRNALLAWDSEFSAKVTDFEQQSTIPHDFVLDPESGNPIASGLVPGATSNAEFENVLSFLGGGFANALHISGDHVDIKTFFSLLENEGIARTLSSPSLTVLSGELATFGVGGSIPIDQSSVTGTGVSQQSVDFINFGVSLSIRPLIDEKGFITLDVVPEITNPDAALTASIRQSSGSNPPTTAFSTRVLRTSSRLRDGQSLLIGGLTQHSQTDSSSQTPWLHNIPILGWLFKDVSYSDGDSELVISVSPVIVRDPPSEASLWAFPDAVELMNPTDWNAKQDPNKASKPADASQAPQGNGK